MKKIINQPRNVVEEMIEGFVFAYGDDLEKVDNHNGLVRKNRKNKVAIIIGGGSGHEPLFLGFLGDGLADGVSIGNVFAAPTPDNIQEVALAAESGKGVLFIYGNYEGDVLNFDMGAELLEMDGIVSQTVKVNDDIASASPEQKENRRGIAGDVFVIKIAGAAAEKGLSLQEVSQVAQKACDNSFSIGVALQAGTMPDTGKPNFVLKDDEIELGMGIHGEPGMERTKMMSADDLTDRMVNKLLTEGNIKPEEEVCVLINGLGSTTLMELLIVSKKVAKMLNERRIKCYDLDVDSYCTTQEMAGFSITIMKLDRDLKEYYDAPANSPYYKKIKFER